MKWVVVCSGPKWAYEKEYIRDTLLKFYDPTYNKGEGHCEFTYDITEALLFDTIEQAVAYTERIPTNGTFTESGMLNRPIHCFEVSYRRISVELEKKAMESRHFTTPASVKNMNPEGWRKPGLDLTPEMQEHKKILRG